jgi:hypothetical protein
LHYNSELEQKRKAGKVATMSRPHYASIFGPTTGDMVRLGDTGLVVEVERDFAVYGDECKFGGGKVLRDGMGQASGVPEKDALDCVLTNAVRRTNLFAYAHFFFSPLFLNESSLAGIVLMMR